jgi:hypothetical protein
VLFHKADGCRIRGGSDYCECSRELDHCWRCFFFVSVCVCCNCIYTNTLSVFCVCSDCKREIYIVSFVCVCSIYIVPESGSCECCESGRVCLC